MKAAKVFTVLNIIGTALVCSLFFITQICLFNFFESGELWIATAYLFVLFAGPIDVLISTIFAIITGRIAAKKMAAEQKKKYLFINILCPVITALLMVIGFFTW